MTAIANSDGMLTTFFRKARGGATADYNLICCHISTNDEKANKFPCFTANGIAFEIVKVQNHYEIRARGEKKGSVKESKSEEVDFFDSASGIRFFRKLKGIQNKKRYVGTVFIKLHGIANTAVVDFIEELMSSENLSFKTERTYSSNELIIVARNYDMPLKDDISELLDKCILLNTYLGSYFIPGRYITAYDIYYRVDCFDDKASMYGQIENIVCPNTQKNYNCIWGLSSQLSNSLFVNGLVLYNTEAGKKAKENRNKEYTEYNFVYTKLSENLKKEVSGK